MDCKSSLLLADSESGEGHQQFCSQLDSALLLGNQRVAVKTLPGAGAGQRQSPSVQPVVSPPPPPPLVPPFSGSSITPSRYCDNVSLGKSSKGANWPNGYRKTISIFLDVIGRNIEVNPVRRGCWEYWHLALFLWVLLTSHLQWAARREPWTGSWGRGPGVGRPTLSTTPATDNRPRRKWPSWTLEDVRMRAKSNGQARVTQLLNVRSSRRGTLVLSTLEYWIKCKVIELIEEKNC